MILLIGLDCDLHLDAAIIELKRRAVNFVRINPERLCNNNTRITLRFDSTGASADISTYSGSFRTGDIKGVWCRFALEAMVADCDDHFIHFENEEFLVALKGALLQIPAELWINDPFLEARADNKPYQLSVAVACGLNVPPTIVSTNQSELSEFADINGPCVIKALGDASLVVDNGQELLGSFTAIFDRKTLGNASEESCPVLLQKCSQKRADVRVTVIDGSCFAAELSQSGPVANHSVDFRNAAELVTHPFTLPDHEKNNLIRMIRRLGLRYASCDFSLDSNGLHFLEANVAGNYLWTELEAGLPITPAIVDALLISA